MIIKPIDAITEADLQALIDSGAPESKQLEFKRALPDASDSGKVKFLRAVTAFANTQGGDLIYGMAEADGVASQLCPLQMSSEDQVRLRLESLCADGAEPRLTGLVRYRFVPLESGGEVLVVRVAKSWTAPHRVTTGGHAHFYGRNASGSYQLDIGELRQAFTLSQTVAERIRAFRADRLLKLGSGDTPMLLADGARVVVHIVPLESMTRDTHVAITGNAQALLKIAPPGASGWNQRYNLDGRLTFEERGNGESDGYALLFRNGIIESVAVYKAHGQQPETIIPSVRYEQETIQALSNYLQALQELDVTPPLYIMISCVGVAGYSLGVDTWRSAIESPRSADRDALIVPEIMLDEWPSNVATALRPAFDMVWNAFGYERSLNYDQGGQWHPRRG
ncbi:MAG: AlbA family DNA-binding domain-containing protein [Gammaproteobacteria bacterium]